ncbi:MAG: hypothetical protein KI785_15940 [Devosiaceae bacterium]|nr:hypothetical protein [Devosiaceae bacterium MH13]
MVKVLSSRRVAEATGQSSSFGLDALVAPTADDLLALTQAALGDIDPPLWLAPAQREQLRMALRSRLAGQLAGTAPGASTSPSKGGVA